MMMYKFFGYMKSKKGQGMSEYALILAGVALLVIAIIALFKDGGSFSNAIEGLLDNISDHILNPSDATITNVVDS